MNTILSGVKGYDAISLTNVKDPELQNALGKLKWVGNVPLFISVTPIKYEGLPSESEILDKNKPTCFSSLLKVFCKNTEKDVLKGKWLIIKAGYHGTNNPQTLLDKGLSSEFESDAYKNGNELAGQGFYVAEDKSVAEGYAKSKGGKAEVLEVWMRMPQDKIDATKIQKTPAHDIVIRPEVFKDVFFVKRSDN